MPTANQAQADYWSSSAGLQWIEQESTLDTAMAEMLGTLLDAAGIKPGERVLDIGCGTGASTLAAAKHAGNGAVVGLDISDPLLERARLRSDKEGMKNVHFILADAQTYSFTDRAFDVLVSRHGMSFFADTDAALGNLSSAMRKGGRMAFISWASVSQNPWFQIPKTVAERRLGNLPETDPTAPGPTAFQDAGRVGKLMEHAGLENVVARPVDLFLTPPNDIEIAAGAASRVGPAARVLKAFGGTKTDAKTIQEEVAHDFMQFSHKGKVRVPAVVNLFTCTT